MIIPNSIPSWYGIVQDAKKYNLDVNINVDPFSGLQSGHFFFRKKGYPFRLELYPKNMILSLKEFNKELFDAWSEILQGNYRVVYETKTEFPFHAEWYFDCEESIILQELERMKTSNKIRILEIHMQPVEIKLENNSL